MKHIGDIPLYTIREFMIDTLKGNAEFETFVSGLSVAPFNFYESSDESRTQEAKSYFIAYVGSNTDDAQSDIEKTLAFKIGIDGDIEPTEIDDVLKFPTEKTIEQIALKIIEILRCRIRDLGINGVKNLILSEGMYYIDERTNTRDYTVDCAMTLNQEKYLN